MEAEEINMEGAAEQSEGEYVFELEEGEHIVGELKVQDLQASDPGGIKLTLTKEDDADDQANTGDSASSSLVDVVHRFLFTNKRMVGFLGAPNSCTTCPPEGASSLTETPITCTRGFYAEYFNCTTHGASPESKTFMVTMSDVVLAEQLEMNPERDCTENLEEAEEAFRDIAAKAPYVVGLLGEFSLSFQCTQGNTAQLLYELFSKGNVLCDDPEEIGGGMLEDLEDEDDYAGLTEEEVEQRMLEDMKQAAEELVNEKEAISKRDPPKTGQFVGESQLEGMASTASEGKMKEEQI